MCFVFSMISQVHSATMHQCMHKMSHKFAAVLIYKLIPCKQKYVQTGIEKCVCGKDPSQMQRYMIVYSNTTRSVLEDSVDPCLQYRF